MKHKERDMNTLGGNTCGLLKEVHNFVLFIIHSCVVQQQSLNENIIFIWYHHGQDWRDHFDLRQTKISVFGSSLWMLLLCPEYHIFSLGHKSSIMDVHVQQVLDPSTKDSLFCWITTSMYFKLDGLPGTSRESNDSWIGLQCWEIEGCKLEWKGAGLERRWIGVALVWRRGNRLGSRLTKGKSARLGFSSNRRCFVSVECTTTVLETGNVGEVAGWRR